MDRLFITVLNMSITASYVLAVVLVLRLILQRMKVPKWMVCLLWIAVFFRLLCPVALTSEYSLLQYVPRREGVVQSGTQMEYITPDVYVQQLPSVAKQTDVVAEPSVVQPTQEMERVAGGLVYRCVAVCRLQRLAVVQTAAAGGYSYASGR